MAATTVNLLIEQGVPFTQVFRAKNADNSNKSLIGFTARMQFRTSYSSSTAELEATTENSKLIIDTADSLVQINLTEEDTQSLTYKQYVFDLELVDSSGVPLRFIQGTATISPEVTRPI